MGMATERWSVRSGATSLSLRWLQPLARNQGRRLARVRPRSSAPVPYVRHHVTCYRVPTPATARRDIAA
eukprot:2231462-Pleurochrysis_carterae.AAC.2